MKLAKCTLLMWYHRQQKYVQLAEILRRTCPYEVPWEMNEQSDSIWPCHGLAFVSMRNGRDFFFKKHQWYVDPDITLGVCTLFSCTSSDSQVLKSENTCFGYPDCCLILSELLLIFIFCVLFQFRQQVVCNFVILLTAPTFQFIFYINV